MKTIILLIGLCSTQLIAALYSDAEITQFLTQQQNNKDSLSTHIFTSPHPKQTLKTWLLSDGDDLEKEYQIYGLLNQLAMSPPDDFFVPLLHELSQFKSTAVKQQAEAKHHNQASEAVFNIASKAAGVLNIWHMNATQQQAADVFSTDTDSVDRIEQLLSNTENGKFNTTLLGIKNAITQASPYQLKQFEQALIQSAPLSKTTYPVIAALAVTTQDTAFTVWAIQQIDKQQSEYLYRSIAQQFPSDQSIDIFTQDIKSTANPAFVASLLKPHVKDPRVSSFLLKQLTNESAAKGAAYALSKSDDPLVWKKMEKIHRNSDVESIRKSIRFSFKRNTEAAAQLILKRLEMQTTANLGEAS